MVDCLAMGIPSTYLEKRSRSPSEMSIRHCFERGLPSVPLDLFHELLSEHVRIHNLILAKHNLVDKPSLPEV